tara:strand:+ start:316 stop:780 length:465 start_codon:yes stop_codon:yes gene_type:complete
MLIDKIKFCVYDNYYKNIDNVESYLINNNLIKLFNVECNTFKVNYNSINAYENTDIQNQVSIFEKLLSSSIKLLKSKILFLESSIELEDNCWFAIIFLTDTYNFNAIKFSTKEDCDEDFVVGKRNRLTIFNNLYCKKITITEKVLVEIVKIEMN